MTMTANNDTALDSNNHLTIINTIQSRIDKYLTEDITSISEQDFIQILQKIVPDFNEKSVLDTYNAFHLQFGSLNRNKLIVDNRLANYICKLYKNKNTQQSSHSVSNHHNSNNTTIISLNDHSSDINDIETLRHEMLKLRRWKKDVGLVAVSRVKRLENEIEIYNETQSEVAQDIDMLQQQQLSNVSDLSEKLKFMRVQSTAVSSENDWLKDSLDATQQETQRNSAKLEDCMLKILRLEKLNADLNALNLKYEEKLKSYEHKCLKNEDTVLNLRNLIYELQCELSEKQEKFQHEIEKYKHESRQRLQSQSSERLRKEHKILQTNMQKEDETVLKLNSDDALSHDKRRRLSIQYLDSIRSSTSASTPASATMYIGNENDMAQDLHLRMLSNDSSVSNYSPGFFSHHLHISDEREQHSTGLESIQSGVSLGLASPTNANASADTYQQQPALVNFSDIEIDSEDEPAFTLTLAVSDPVSVNVREEAGIEAEEKRTDADMAGSDLIFEGSAEIIELNEHRTPDTNYSIFVTGAGTDHHSRHTPVNIMQSTSNGSSGGGGVLGNQINSSKIFFDETILKEREYQLRNEIEEECHEKYEMHSQQTEIQHEMEVNRIRNEYELKIENLMKAAMARTRSTTTTQLSRDEDEGWAMQPRIPSMSSSSTSASSSSSMTRMAMQKLIGDKMEHQRLQELYADPDRTSHTSCSSCLNQ